MWSGSKMTGRGETEKDKLEWQQTIELSEKRWR